MSTATSDDFKAQIYRSHERVVVIEVLKQGSTEATVPGVTGGAVTVDASQSSRRRATVPLVDANGELVPGVSTDLLYPAGNELRAWRGIDFLDDRPGYPADIAPRGCELVPVFTGPLFENAIDDQPKGIEQSLDCYDRSRFIQRARWMTPYLVPAGARWVDVIRDAILDRMPGTIPLDFAGFMEDATTVPRDFAVPADPNGDPWKIITKWATRALGAELFFDGLGNPILRDVPSINNDPVVARFRQGQTGGLLGVKKRISLEKVYNVVKAAGEGTGSAAPVEAIVRDDDPESATYTGAIGEAGRFFSSPLLTTVGQCRKAAQSLLNKRLGGTVTIEWTSMVNPALDAGDVVRIARPRAKVDLACILDAFPIPFDVSSPVSCAARSRKG